MEKDLALEDVLSILKYMQQPFSDQNSDSSVVVQMVARASPSSIIPIWAAAEPLYEG